MKTKLTILAVGLLLSVAQAQTNYQRLKSFGIPELSGAYPQSPPIVGRDGKLYGTTEWGGNNNAGTVFKVNPDGSGYMVLYIFNGSVDGLDGAVPQTRLVEGHDGALYGTTSQGGTNHAGTIFKINLDGGGYTVLRSFTNSRGVGLVRMA